ncbi:hypothetical protein LepocDRAFT_00002300 [Leptothrix ochracea L12]|uniref:Uncharacterized protein n=1 Tax=Leptothrix ochracea L12 TaxID=735332 RepID=I4Z5K7_9BURK|nr:hypothetical protein LepocDRAFT_00002300 [Leptothrix ochracea L12]
MKPLFHVLLQFKEKSRLNTACCTAGCCVITSLHRRPIRRMVLLSWINLQILRSCHQNRVLTTNSNDSCRHRSNHNNQRPRNHQPNHLYLPPSKGLFNTLFADSSITGFFCILLIHGYT